MQVGGDPPNHMLGYQHGTDVENVFTDVILLQKVSVVCCSYLEVRQGL